MKKLPYGSLKNICERSNLPRQYISDIVSTRKRPSRKRAIQLENICSEIGKPIPAAIWIFGTSQEIKGALLEGS